SLIGILEAAEQLISAGFSPKRTIYIASGYDEEIGGKNGALKTAQELKQRGIFLDFVLDEGFTIIEPDIFTLLNGPIALIGIAEKGIMDIMITADGEEGHASMPPKNTAAGKLAKAIVAVEKNPFPARIIPTMKSFLKAIAPEVKGITGFILRHSGIFAFLIKKSFALSPTNNAMIRTTQAVTMLKGSEKENVLPKKASAVINIRILPGDTTESVLERIKGIINDKSVKVEVPEYFDAGNPVDESNLKSEGYKIIEESIHETFPGIFTAPSIVLATTDSRHYKEVSENIFRFVPIRINKSNLKTIHGTNERIKEEDFLKVVDFYKNLINRL
ncbi:MAG: M20/M25/M40 family metallo-hydrolase, partial [Spirochaetales bacterium]|nr:M20/M25/M40 family metallo-hydrolase [Spirochaetales bacterium]